MWPGWGYGQFSQEAVWAATVSPGLNAGKSLVSLLPAWQSAIGNYAKADGYQVTHPVSTTTTNRAGAARSTRRACPGPGAPGTGSSRSTCCC